MLRNMDDRVTSIQIRLKDYDRDAKVVEGPAAGDVPHRCGWRFRPGRTSRARCWRPSASSSGILNVLLFLIIGVAGFGILAIFR